jgi:hypothetical protein
MGAGPKAQCKLCLTVIQSMHRHDFVWCKCQKIAIDGGDAYTKCSGEFDHFEWNETKFIEGEINDKTTS